MQGKCEYKVKCECNFFRPLQHLFGWAFQRLFGCDFLDSAAFVWLWFPRPLQRLFVGLFPAFAASVRLDFFLVSASSVWLGFLFPASAAFVWLGFPGLCSVCWASGQCESEEMLRVTAVDATWLLLGWSVWTKNDSFKSKISLKNTYSSQDFPWAL